MTFPSKSSSSSFFFLLYSSQYILQTTQSHVSFSLFKVTPSFCPNLDPLHLPKRNHPVILKSFPHFLLYPHLLSLTLITHVTKQPWRHTRVLVLRLVCHYLFFFFFMRRSYFCFHGLQYFHNLPQLQKSPNLFHVEEMKKGLKTLT